MGLIPHAMRPPAASRAGRLHVVRGQGQTDRLAAGLPRAASNDVARAGSTGRCTDRCSSKPQDRGLWGNTPGLVLPADFSAVASDSLQHRAGMAAGSFQLLDFETAVKIHDGFFQTVNISQNIF